MSRLSQLHHTIYLKIINAVEPMISLLKKHTCFLFDDDNIPLLKDDNAQSVFCKEMNITTLATTSIYLLMEI